MPFEAPGASKPGKMQSLVGGRPDPMVQPALANAMRFGKTFARMAPGAGGRDGRRMGTQAGGGPSLGAMPMGQAPGQGRY